MPSLSFPRLRQGLELPASMRKLKKLRFSSGGFTLIELLTVICVAALLMGITASFLGNTKSGRLNVAGNRVVDLLHEARQNSLSKNSLTAAVVVTDPSFGNQYRLLALFQLLPRSDGSASSASDWTQVSNWETLENGVILDTSVIANNALQSYQSTSPFPMPVPQYNSRTVAQYEYVLFLPNGSLSTTPAETNPAILNLVDGFFAGSSSTPTYTDPHGSGYANYYRITVLAATGGIKIDRP
jgi:prepilin-type N-terminal cleavage/methylation domain-containing protein